MTRQIKVKWGEFTKIPKKRGRFSKMLKSVEISLKKLDRVVKKMAPIDIRMKREGKNFLHRKLTCPYHVISIGLSHLCSTHRQSSWRNWKRNLKLHPHFRRINALFWTPLEQATRTKFVNCLPKACQWACAKIFACITTRTNKRRSCMPQVPLILKSCAFF